MSFKSIYSHTSIPWEWGSFSNSTLEKCVLTETNEGSLVAGEAHPADQRGARGSDTPLAVIHSKDVSSVQALQVRPESTQRHHSEL